MLGDFTLCTLSRYLRYKTLGLGQIIGAAILITPLREAKVQRVITTGCLYNIDTAFLAYSCDFFTIASTARPYGKNSYDDNDECENH